MPRARIRRDPTTISFEVMAVIERKAPGLPVVTYRETELRHYCTGERLVIRGKPKWKLGEKVDFEEMPPLEQRRRKRKRKMK